MSSSSLECPKSMQVPLPGFLQINYQYPHPQICQRLLVCATPLVRVYRDQRSGLLKALKQRSLRLSHLDSVQVATTTGLVIRSFIYQWKLQENLWEESGPKIMLYLGLGNGTRWATFSSSIKVKMERYETFSKLFSLPWSGTSLSSLLFFRSWLSIFLACFRPPKCRFTCLVLMISSLHILQVKQSLTLLDLSMVSILLIFFSLNIVVCNYLLWAYLTCWVNVWHL